MKSLMGSMLALLLVLAPGNFRNLQAAAQQSEDQQSSQQPQNSQGSQNPQATQDAQGNASSSTAVQSMTGCLIKTDSGYALKTDDATVPLETGKDLSQYVNKQIKVTGILEHHNAEGQSASGSPATITDLRLRLVASVVGDCAPSAK